MNDQLDKLKIALQITDNEHDDLLQLYLDDATDFLKLRLSVHDLPDEMQAIVRGAAVKKFNRFKNEGMASYSQDGESITFSSNDFDEWSNEIEQWKNDHNNVNQGMWVNPYEV
ncbi:phage head-tail connector protein [Lactobacillus crispatus]|uniref:phage head-tail connector protein n=1 Tax=Lactobacillus crispatus TaxID=47770 RepID=UPI0018AC6E76|nr:phage head-tail connector protein [Lactobacillus crispatus]